MLDTLSPSVQMQDNSEGGEMISSDEDEEEEPQAVDLKSKGDNKKV